MSCPWPNVGPNPGNLPIECLPGYLAVLLKGPRPSWLRRENMNALGVAPYLPPCSKKRTKELKTSRTFSSQWILSFLSVSAHCVHVCDGILCFLPGVRHRDYNESHYSDSKNHPWLEPKTWHLTSWETHRIHTTHPKGCHCILQRHTVPFWWQ